MSSSVSGGEWSSQAERGPGRSGAGRAAGVRGALTTPLCTSQWGQSQGFHVPQWHQGELLWLSTTSFGVCLPQEDNDVILQMTCRSVSVFLPFHSSCRPFLKPLCQSNPGSFCSHRFWQWPAWLCPCQRCLQSNGPSDALNEAFFHCWLKSPLHFLEPYRSSQSSRCTQRLLFLFV